MVNKCCVQSCKSKGGQQIKFHRFPKGDICDLWIKFIKQHKPLFEKTISSNVCGLHFDSDLDYEVSNTSICKTKMLKKNAVPSIINPTARKILFNEPKLSSDENSEEEVVTLSLSNLHSNSSEPTPSSAVAEPNPIFSSPSTSSSTNIIFSPSSLQGTNTVEETSTSTRKRKCFMGDFKSPDDIESPNSRLKYWIASQITTNNQRKRIKYLHKKTVDLKKQIKTLKDLVDHLKDDKKLISDN